MAIDDNTSYELTGAQVKDLANKIKAKAADNIFVGATSAAPGSKGLVPQPQAGDDTKFLSGDGTWKTVQSGSSKRILTWDNGAMYDEDYNAISGGDVYTALQSGDVEVVNTMPSLIIENGFYASWTDPTYGTLSDVLFFTTEQTSPNGAMTRTQYLYDETNGWLTPRTMNIQEQLTAGSNISISGNTISANVKLVEMSYGESNAWAKFIAAYNAGSIVYCRASSSSNPASGSQTRKAFMAYVNNASNPTSVEFQYVRSNSSKSDSNQCDQVFVYTLTNSNGGTWSVASRDMAPKILVDSTLNKTFSGGANASVTLGAKAMTGATGSAAGKAGYVPAPVAGDQNKVLKGDGTWGDAPITTTFYMNTFSEGDNVTLYKDSGKTEAATRQEVSDAFTVGEIKVAIGPDYMRQTYYGKVTSFLKAKNSGGTEISWVITIASVAGYGEYGGNLAWRLNAAGTTDGTLFTARTATLGANSIASKLLDGIGSYSSSEVETPFTWVDGSTIYKRTFKTDNISAVQTVVTHGISNFGALVNAEGVMHTASQGYQPLDRVLPSLMSTWGWGLGDVNATTFTLFFGSGYTLSEITTWITLYYTKSS